MKGARALIRIKMPIGVKVLTKTRKKNLINLTTRMGKPKKNPSQHRNEDD